jgi:hypothetical protein
MIFELFKFLQNEPITVITFLVVIIPAYIYSFRIRNKIKTIKELDILFLVIIYGGIIFLISLFVLAAELPALQNNTDMLANSYIKSYNTTYGELPSQEDIMKFKNEQTIFQISYSTIFNIVMLSIFIFISLSSENDSVNNKFNKYFKVRYRRIFWPFFLYSVILYIIMNYKFDFNLGFGLAVINTIWLSIPIREIFTTFDNQILGRESKGYLTPEESPGIIIHSLRLLRYLLITLPKKYVNRLIELFQKGFNKIRNKYS